MNESDAAAARCHDLCLRAVNGRYWTRAGNGSDSQVKKVETLA